MRFLISAIAVVFWAGASAKADVYLDKDAALGLILGADCQARADFKALDPGIISELKSARLWGPDSETAHFFICETKSGEKRFALIDSEVGKHMPITYIVGIDSKGRETRTEIMVFREKIGWEARERSFLAQFDGKTDADPIKLGDDIQHVTGATLSCRAIAKGVRRALFLWRHFYGAA